MGVDSEEGLGSMLSTAMVSVTERPREDMKTHGTKTAANSEGFMMLLKTGNRNFEI